MTGYEKSPDYGNPPKLTWQQWVKGIVIFGAIGGFIAWALLK